MTQNSWKNIFFYFKKNFVGKCGELWGNFTTFAGKLKL